MKQAIIDMGSNSMRLTVYTIQGEDFTILFKDKVVAGLAGYVEKGKLTAEGIECACNVLLNFRYTLESLEIDNTSVFATASLRNIANTEEVTDAIKHLTGFSVEVLSGQEEAYLGYLGAMRELNISEGAFIDIGGASTEIVTFHNEEALQSSSCKVGSLSLYRSCVKKILPKSKALKNMQARIEENIIFPFDQRNPLVCVGGTGRAALKLAKKLKGLEADTRSVSTNDLEDLYEFLRKGTRPSIDLILKQEPHRIHTMLPGLMILRYIYTSFGAQEIVVSSYGVREGYLCQKIL